MSKTITSYRLKILAKIDELSAETGVTSPKDVAYEIGSTSEVLRVTLIRLKKAGWLDNPYFGSWRLTKEGKLLLQRVRGERYAEPTGGI